MTPSQWRKLDKRLGEFLDYIPEGWGREVIGVCTAGGFGSALSTVVVVAALSLGT